MLNAVWNYHQNGDYEEIGFSKGWSGANINAFYVYYRKSGVFGQWKLTTQPSGSGTLHNYAIYRMAGSYTWVMALDTYETFLINMGSINDKSQQIQVGGEMTGSNSTMETTTSSSLKYYLTYNQVAPIDWPEASFCQHTVHMEWEWITFRLAGRAWTP
jgi:hypothetical protein